MLVGKRQGRVVQELEKALASGLLGSLSVPLAGSVTHIRDGVGTVSYGGGGKLLTPAFPMRGPQRGAVYLYLCLLFPIVLQSGP